jgi:hypothetical protein
MLFFYHENLNTNMVWYHISKMSYVFTINYGLKYIKWDIAVGFYILQFIVQIKRLLYFNKK